MDYLKYIAKSYRINQHPMGKEATSVLLNHFPHEIKNVLEIGCGTGHTAAIINHLKPNITYAGMDLSKEMINACVKRKERLKLNNCEFIHFETFPYPFESNRFDVIFCESVIALQNQNQLQVIFNEVRRTLKNKGLFIINESLWKKTTPQEMVTKINNVTKKKFGLIQASSVAYPNLLKQVLKEHGLAPVIFEPLKNFISNQRTNDLSEESEKFSRKKIILSSFNIKRLYSYIYFKYWNFRFRRYGNFIEPYLMICKKGC